MEAFHSQARGVRLLIAIVFFLFALSLLSMGVSLAELSIGCLQLSRSRRLPSTGGEVTIRLTIPVYLIVSGVVSMLSSLTNGACLRGRQLPEDEYDTRRLRQRPRRPRIRLRVFVYSVGGMLHVFSLTWLIVGFYAIYTAPAVADDVKATATAVLNSTGLPTTASTTSAGAEAAEALPLLWLRLAVGFLELLIVVVMLTCCRSSAGVQQNDTSCPAADVGDAEANVATSKLVDIVEGDADADCVAG